MKINIKDVTETDFLAFTDVPLVDCHVYAEKTEGITVLEDIWQRYRIDKMNILATSSYSELRVANNAICLLFKLRHPGKAFGFGSLYYPPPGTPTDGKELLEQVQWLMSFGFDGMKMLDGKPTTGKGLAYPWIHLYMIHTLIILWKISFHCCIMSMIPQLSGTRKKYLSMLSI